MSTVVDSRGREFSVYQNIPTLKGMYNGDTPFTADELISMDHCSEDPIHFIRNYMKIVNVDEGFVPFEMWDFQEDMVRTYNESRYAVTLCPRQVGKSTTVAGYLLWYVLFHKTKKCCILAHKKSAAVEILSRIKKAYEALPLWMQQGVKEWNKGRIELENGSIIVAESTSAGSIRGDSFNLVFLDEFAHVENNQAEDFFASVYPTIASGKTTKCIIVSTPKGMNHFYKIWTEAEEGKNSYTPIRVRWQDVPGRDEEWKKETIANTSERQFAQEQECEFLGSSGTLIDGRVLANMPHREPIYQKEGMFVYEKPKTGHIYMVTVDVSEGLQKDRSAFSIIDATEIPYRQVAVFRRNDISPMIYPSAIHKAAKAYNNAWVLVELNANGDTVANSLWEDFEYDNIFMIENAGRAGQRISSGFGGKVTKKGLTQSSATKKVGCSNLKSLIEDQKLIVNDFETISELTTFTQQGNSYKAEEGKFDDHAMTLVMFGWLVGQDSFKELSDTDIRKRIHADQQKAIEEEMLGMMFWDGIGEPEPGAPVHEIIEGSPFDPYSTQDIEFTSNDRYDDYGDF